MTVIKICGITNLDDAKVSIESGADMLGFILSDSPRRVDLGTLESILDEIQSKCKSVGVFATRDDLNVFLSECDIQLDYYQIYFDPNGSTARPPCVGCIRAHWMDKNESSISTEAEFTLLDFKNCVTESIHEKMSAALATNCKRIIFAGNLSPENVAKAVLEWKPWGVDVARGVETALGRKDRQLIRRFIENVRSVE